MASDYPTPGGGPGSLFLPEFPILSPVCWALHSPRLVVAVQGIVKPRQVDCRQGGHKRVRQTLSQVLHKSHTAVQSLR